MIHTERVTPLHSSIIAAVLVKLTLAIAAINSWNRLNIAFRVQAGGYQPGMFKHAVGV